MGPTQRETPSSVTTKKRGISMANNPRCPTQDKQGFMSEEHLRKRLCRNPEAMGMHPYRCTCGYWHMGHKKKRAAA
jgi:Zn ribbon nucleic-acid-binding protein